ncbi:DUF1837 domain-containing protein [Pseudoalteromonas piscicida]|uniref:HamA C-terminal domain-containing protein n=1 Tax=Pseudoalteromonas piscicida TaxID=43662 RepID=UPI000E3596B0|nr:DUF1837 domain-containing protein [Pseudoalteromonas piscicida]AXQ98028.1 DUF1837 domain-containing protein [Pseudoalteromonas piscicida]
MNFEVLVEDDFLNFCIDDSLQPVNNKTVLSLLNDYQEGKWRHSKFHNFVWDNISETSLSYAERESLVDQSRSRLVEAAQSLRLTDSTKDIGKGSELAEIMLYGIMKHHFKALPVVPKIFYKQNAQDNAKGADSVHIVLDENDDFTIWFGEAKFFNDISDARLGDIVKSVGNSLVTDKLKRENAIITNVSDIDQLIHNERLRADIKQALNQRESIDNIKPRLHIPILLLHECSITAANNCFNDDYKQAIVDFHSDRATAYFKKHIEQLAAIHLYESIYFHLILFPVPEKNKIVNRFVADVKHYKEAAKDE